MITRRGLADEIDALDAKIAVLQLEKSRLLKRYRAQLRLEGRSHQEIAVEMALVRQGAGFNLRRSKRIRPSDFQPPRPATRDELRSAYRSGRPISQDYAFQGAHVYFAECPDTGRLKIGISNNVPSRIRGLSQASGSNLVLIATIPGNRQEELRALDTFSAWRLKGEWHRLTEDCRARILEYVTVEGGKVAA